MCLCVWKSVSFQRLIMWGDPFHTQPNVVRECFSPVAAVALYNVSQRDGATTRHTRLYCCYVYYCHRSFNTRLTTIRILILQELSQKLGDDKSLSEHLQLPIQRINDYQLLLKVSVYFSSVRYHSQPSNVHRQRACCVSKTIIFALVTTNACRGFKISIICASISRCCCYSNGLMDWCNV